MAEVKRRGRPKMTEEEKLARKQAKEQEKLNKINSKTNNETELEAETDTTSTEEVTDKIIYDCPETCVSYCQGDEFLRFYSTQVKGKKFIKRMLEEHPDKCKPLMYDGKDCVQISMPPECLWYIRFPYKRELTEEQRDAARERMNKARGLKNK